MERCVSHLDLASYSSGAERSVFQSRALMAVWLSTVGKLPLWTVLAGRLPGVFRDPLLLSLVFPTFVFHALSFLAVWDAARRLFWQAWAPVLCLGIACWITTITYAGSVRQAFFYPYDPPALFFMAAAVWLLAQKRTPWLLLLAPAASFNRETAFFILPLFLLWQGLPPLDRRFTWQAWRPMVTQGSLMLVLLVAGRGAALAFWPGRLDPVAGGGMENHLIHNLTLVRSPFELLSAAASLGFLFPVWAAVAQSVRIHALRRAQWIAVPFVLALLYAGVLSEIRIFGELVPLASLCVASGSIGAFAPRRKKTIPAQKAGVAVVQAAPQAVSLVPRTEPDYLPLR